MQATLHPSSLDFLQAIRDHNSREYFALVKPLYEDIWSQVKEFCRACIHNCASYNSALCDLSVQDCLFRIYRDARRIKDGDQIYKPNFGLVIGEGGKKSDSISLYVHIEPGNCFVAVGSYMPHATQLLHFRNFILRHGTRYLNVIQEKSFIKHFGQVQGKSLHKMPRGFDADTSYASVIKQKQFLVYRFYTDTQALSNDFIKHITQDYRIARPWMQILQEGYSYQIGTTSDENYYGGD